MNEGGPGYSTESLRVNNHVPATVEVAKVGRSAEREKEKKKHRQTKNVLQLKMSFWRYCTLQAQRDRSSIFSNPSLTPYLRLMLERGGSGEVERQFVGGQVVNSSAENAISRCFKRSALAERRRAWPAARQRDVRRCAAPRNRNSGMPVAPNLAAQTLTPRRRT